MKLMKSCSNNIYFKLKSLELIGLSTVTKNFHHALHVSRAKSNLTSLMVNDTLCDDVSIISQHIQEFYKHLFLENEEEGGSLNFVQDLLQKVVTLEQNIDLVRPPLVGEIKQAIFAISAVSAPGPDGFGGSFFQSSWDIISHDISNAVSFFFTSALIPTGLNSNVVILIPKVAGASRVEDYRPIVLGNFLFKILTKIISTRIGPLLNHILSPSHYGFISGRRIQHCIVACSEIFQIINKGAGHIALKIDIRKVFDTMRWAFLLKVLDCLGFDHHFRKLINAILHSARLSISINGKLEGFFSCPRGVRQSDSLSTILFTIGEEVLAKMMEYRGVIPHIIPRG